MLAKEIYRRVDRRGFDQDHHLHCLVTIAGFCLRFTVDVVSVVDCQVHTAQG